MAEGARVDSILVLTDFKAVLWKFRESAERALGDAESEMQRVLVWLETEQDSHWQHQIRKCQETVVRCKEAVRMKTIFKDAAGRQQSAVDEEKALRIAVRKLQEAEQKLAAVRRWSRQLQKEIGLYKGSVQRFATTVQSEIPAAAAHLESLAAKLDAYASLTPGAVIGAEGSEIVAGAGAGGGSMARAPDTPSAPVAVRFSVPPIPAEQQRVIANIPAPRQPVVPDSRLRIDPASEMADSLILRHDPSGWVIAPADANTSASGNAIAIGQLLDLRPDFGELLTLPMGFSVMIGPEGIAALHDAGGSDVWSEVKPRRS
ncbi:MAG TPA: hypothetical protein VN541_08080 [Tepidisphaeraceae bacterium]|nr:hypothetical protein [Tepidisphaeraceae bacterium]